MKHPFMVTWVDDAGKAQSSSFRSEARRDAVAGYKLAQGYTVYVAEQMQLVSERETEPASTYDPRYEIPF